ncbi:autotransporter outer membrane beta-barrel domain-containing protein [Enterobacteriaceae bacterium G50]|nr:autotransporter outer membrane beta-barrel domain-containing protein [Enterobacteriaceae bacterium G50]
MSPNPLIHPMSKIALVVSLILSAQANAGAVNNIDLFASYTPVDTNTTVTINENNTVTLSSTENTESEWDQFKSLIIGKDTDGSMIIDNREINTQSPNTNDNIIGANSTGSLTLTNGAKWSVNRAYLSLGTNGGKGTLVVEKGSQITGIGELRVGEFASTAEGVVIIDGENSSVETQWTMVGDQGTGYLAITNGGHLSVARSLVSGFNGYPELNQAGHGEVLVDGDQSTLDVTSNLTVGGFGADVNSAFGTLTISNGATVNVGNELQLGYSTTATGILNIGGAVGEAEQGAGTLNAPVILLGREGDTSTAILNFNHNSEDFTLAANIVNHGEVNQIGSGITTLSGANTYTGTTHVSNGTLRAGTENTFSANSDYVVDSAGTLDLNGHDQTLNSLVLAGNASLSSGEVSGEFTPTTLTINGDYTADNGLLALRTVLGDDNSVTDKLVVLGDTAGDTRVSISNAGGTGSQTIEGIRIVDVSGESNGTFAKEGRIVAGGYDYNIVKRDNQNWYLTSEAIPDPVKPVDPVDPVDPIDPKPPVDPVDPVPPVDPVDPVPPVDPVDPVPPVDPVDPVPPVDPVDPVPPVDPIPTQPEGEHQYRPESGSYLANAMANNTLFNTRLHDRLGETQYTDALTGEQKVTSLWMRNVGGHTRFKDGSDQLSTQSNRYVLQMGGDIAQWSSNGQDRLHLGLMAGYANSKSRTHSRLTGYSSRGEVSGYSAGLYGTWYANELDKTGLYVDSWVLYNWFDNKVSGEDLATEKYDADGVTASIESGYSFRLGESSDARTSYWLQPKLQLTWMDVQADSLTEHNGTRVSDKTDGNLQTRLGVKAYLQGNNKLDDGKDRTFQPFVEANWIYNSDTYRVKMDDISNDISGTRNVGELKVGVEGQINKRLQLWGNVAQQLGDNGYSDTQGMLGVKYSF